MRREFRWGSSAEAAVRPPVVVVGSPAVDDRPSLSQGCEQLTRQAFVAEAAVEALHVTVLPEAAWLDIRGSDIDLRQKAAEAPADELRTVVGAKVLGLTADGEQVHQGLDHAIAGQSPSHFQANALTRELVDDRQDFHRATILCPIKDEIHRPNVIRTLSSPPFNAAFTIPETTFLRLFHGHFQALLTPKAIDSLFVHSPAFPS